MAQTGSRAEALIFRVVENTQSVRIGRESRRAPTTVHYLIGLGPGLSTHFVMYYEIYALLAHYLVVGWQLGAPEGRCSMTYYTLVITLCIMSNRVT